MTHWTPENIVALVAGLTALLAALPAIILALKGQGDHKENAAKIEGVKVTAAAALEQSGQALLNTPTTPPAQIVVDPPADIQVKAAGDDAGGVPQ